MDSLFLPEEVANLYGRVIPPIPHDYRLPTEFPRLHEATRIALDFESHDPDIKDKGPGWRRDAYPVGIAVAAEWKDKTCFQEYYPVAHKGVENLDGAKVFEWLCDELAFYDREIVGANSLYEIDGLSYQGVFAPSARWRDVQMAEALLDESAYNYQLNTLAKKYLGEHKVTDELKTLYGPDYITAFRDIHPGHARAYGLGDVTLPLRILDAQKKQLKKENLDELFDLECRLLPMLIYMRRRGQRVDLTAARGLGDMLLAKRDTALKECSKRCGFELNYENFSRPAVIGAALDRLKITYPITPVNKQPSIKDKWLEALDDPFGPALATANKCEKALGTFVTGYVLDYAIEDRIHAEFHPLRKVDDESGKKNGTITGRFSCTHPNLQNIPTRDDQIGPLCRAMFIPEQGYDFFSIDYSQIEFRLLVHAAVTCAQNANPEGKKRPWNDETHARLQSAFKAQKMYQDDPTTDFHNMVVTLTNLARKYAKNINFGIAFSMGTEKLAIQLGLLTPEGKPSQKALDIMQQYHDNVPFVKAVSQALMNMAEEEGFTATLLGRRSRFDKYEPKWGAVGDSRKPGLPLEEAKMVYGKKLKRSMTYKALNCFTQGGGADLMKTSMVKVWEAGLVEGDELIISMTVHDELGGSVLRNKIGQEKLAELKHIMETAIPIAVPTTTEAKTGATWRDTH